MSVINWSNVTDFSQLPGLANASSGGLFWSGVLWLMFIVLILVLVSYGLEVAVTVAAFLAFAMSFLFVYNDLVGWGHIVAFAGILLFMYLYITWSSGRKQ